MQNLKSSDVVFVNVVRKESGSCGQGRGRGGRHEPWNRGVGKLFSPKKLANNRGVGKLFSPKIGKKLFSPKNSAKNWQIIEELENRFQRKNWHKLFSPKKLAQIVFAEKIGKKLFSPKKLAKIVFAEKMAKNCFRRKIGKKLFSPKKLAKNCFRRKTRQKNWRSVLGIRISSCEKTDRNQGDRMSVIKWTQPTQFFLNKCMHFCNFEVTAQRKQSTIGRKFATSGRPDRNICF
jgi:hypothetical protein